MAAMRQDVTKLSGEELDNLVRGFQGIQALSPNDPDSFAQIASYHGLPAWNCQHGNVLFPLWHRAYILRLERALRNVLKDDTFAMPFWNETSDSSAKDGLPSIFTKKTYEWSDGSGSVPNPLFSYKLQAEISDPEEGHLYTKPVGYQTVRYPWSGLVSGDFGAKTEAHNAEVAAKPEAEVTKLLNDNVIAWLTKEVYRGANGGERPAGELHKFKECLNAPNYTVFSNTTSAADWNKKHGSPHIPVVVPLEEPHNALHLAIGGFSVPGQGDLSAYDFANGDMGDNETAAFDPIFYFHHCFIDYTFWKWQVLNHQTKDLPIDKSLAGVGSRSLETDLTPFSALEINGQNRPVKGKDLVNVNNLGYSYPPVPELSFLAPNIDAPKLAVTGINRKHISGSFLVTTWARGDDQTPDRLLKVEPVLSRWNVSQCENCQEHLEVESHIHLLDYTHQEAKDAKFYSLIHTYGDVQGVGMESSGIKSVGMKSIGARNSSINIELRARD
ncbi:hypothetical protein QBC36DRAFT_334134 [Triangularia setosa]|uniref:tyrosinase n=1 Tax=Triangularia setosa TaxID=2587417 RepID=A0AAN7A5N2_9PEZI|nr:hypothetical protein QBC36DRAFT_334134 [Podospora setosa]